LKITNVILFYNWEIRDLKTKSSAGIVDHTNAYVIMDVEL